MYSNSQVAYSNRWLHCAAQRSTLPVWVLVRKVLHRNSNFLKSSEQDRWHQHRSGCALCGSSASCFTGQNDENSLIDSLFNCSAGCHTMGGCVHTIAALRYSHERHTGSIIKPSASEKLFAKQDQFSAVLSWVVLRARWWPRIEYLEIGYRKNIGYEGLQVPSGGRFQCKTSVFHCTRTLWLPCLQSTRDRLTFIWLFGKRVPCTCYLEEVERKSWTFVAYEMFQWKSHQNLTPAAGSWPEPHLRCRAFFVFCWSRFKTRSRRSCFPHCLTLSRSHRGLLLSALFAYLRDLALSFQCRIRASTYRQEHCLAGSDVKAHG